MFRSKTVFILGAGASKEVGLPLGEELKKKIADNVYLDIDDFGKIVACKDFETIDVLKHYANQNNLKSPLNTACRLYNALPHAASIDNLLDAHSGDELFEVCGKLGIVRSILESERESKIYYDYNQKNKKKINFDKLCNTWFSGFVKALVENVQKNKLDGIFDNVSILNFNYDRCVEHYLFESLQDYYFLERGEAEEVVRKLNILHPYGSVGKLPWQVNNSQNAVPFGAKTYNMLDLSSQIKTFSEKVSESENINKIRLAVQEAEIIVFLGFAFHRQNLDLIRPKSNSKVKKIFATAYEISKSDCEIISAQIYETLRTQTSNIVLRSDLTCGSFFKEYWRSLTA